MQFTDTFIVAPQTLELYKSFLRKNIYPYLTSFDAKNADHRTIYYMLTKWSHLSVPTKRKMLGLLRRYVEFHGGTLDTSKVDRQLSRLRQPRKIKALTFDEAEKLLTLAKSKNTLMYRVILLALHTGMRKGELFGLRMKDLDFENRTLFVQSSYDGPTKNGRCRTVPMSQTVYDMLIKIRFRANKTNPNPLLFPRFNPYDRCKGLLKKAKLPPVTFHGLRHTFATLALESNTSKKNVQEILGHSKLSTTLDIYWAPSREPMIMNFLPEVKNDKNKNR